VLVAVATTDPESSVTTPSVKPTREPAFTTVPTAVSSPLVAGLATGVLNAVLGRESVANVPADRAAMGSGSNNTARYLGAACGITVFSVVLSHAGTGVGAAGLVDGWTTAVLVASAVSIVGAVVIGAIGLATRSPRPVVAQPAA
jgi:hypothetical protein